MESLVKSFLVVRFDTMNLFWTLLLCELGFQSTAQLLSNIVIPLNYKLDLYANLGDRNNDFEFSGFVSITIKCLKKTNTITLHSKNLRLGPIDVTHNGKGLNNIKSTIPFDQKKDLLTLRLPAALKKGNVYRVAISFAGKFEKVLKEGFFLSSSENPKTHKTVYNASTYFQNGNARKVFPCLDEPEFKATFEINIAHAKKYKAVSNAPLNNIESISEFGGNWIRTYFKKTEPLSTDQLTIVVFEPKYS